MFALGLVLAGYVMYRYGRHQVHPNHQDRQDEYELVQLTHAAAGVMMNLVRDRDSVVSQGSRDNVQWWLSRFDSYNWRKQEDSSSMEH
jgi:hypothetical protein